MFHDILERKNVFLRLKNKKFKKSKIIIFPKGLAHGFGQKLVIFLFFLFILGDIGQENVFHDILEWKNIFVDHKNNLK